MSLSSDACEPFSNFYVAIGDAFSSHDGNNNSAVRTSSRGEVAVRREEEGPAKPQRSRSPHDILAGTRAQERLMLR